MGLREEAVARNVAPIHDQLADIQNETGEICRSVYRSIPGFIVNLASTLNSGKGL